jgi:hypothetical protein
LITNKINRLTIEFEETVLKDFQLRTQSDQYEENVVSEFTHVKIEINRLSTKSGEKTRYIILSHIHSVSQQNLYLTFHVS